MNERLEIKQSFYFGQNYWFDVINKTKKNGIFIKVKDSPYSDIRVFLLWSSVIATKCYMWSVLNMQDLLAYYTPTYGIKHTKSTNVAFYYPTFEVLFYFRLLVYCQELTRDLGTENWYAFCLFCFMSLRKKNPLMLRRHQL